MTTARDGERGRAWNLHQNEGFPEKKNGGEKNGVREQKEGNWEFYRLWFLPPPVFYQQSLLYGTDVSGRYQSAYGTSFQKPAQFIFASLSIAWCWQLL